MAKKQAKKQVVKSVKEEVIEEKAVESKAKESVVSAKEPVSDAVKAQKAMEAKKERSRRILEEGPQIATFIPLEPGEREGAVCRVRHNGNLYEYEKGVQHVVPVPINEIIMESIGVRQSAGQSMRADRDQKTIEALS